MVVVPCRLAFPRSARSRDRDVHQHQRTLGRRPLTSSAPHAPWTRSAPHERDSASALTSFFPPGAVRCGAAGGVVRRVARPLGVCRAPPLAVGAPVPPHCTHSVLSGHPTLRSPEPGRTPPKRDFCFCLCFPRLRLLLLVRFFPSPSGLRIARSAHDLPSAFGRGRWRLQTEGPVCYQN